MSLRFGQNLSWDLWKTCVKNFAVRSFSWSAFFRIWTKYWKIQIRKYSKFGHFLRSEIKKKKKKKKKSVFNNDLTKKIYFLGFVFGGSTIIWQI